MSDSHACNERNCYLTTDKRFLDDLVNRVTETYEDEKGINHLEGVHLPSENEVYQIIQNLLEVIFPGYSGVRCYNLSTVRYNIGQILERVYYDLSGQITRAFKYGCKVNCCAGCNVSNKSREATESVLDQIPKLRQDMKLDIAAAFEGDPAARSIDEIVLSYPGVKAITIQRLAHIMYDNEVPLIPRMMTEYAHSVTGIDIHPGATLGQGMFIDHGTGVVVGETARIGANCKLYQGVTLGALSFPRDASGNIIKGQRRHPTLEDNVTIYSGATILGDITIGNGSVIGGNVWLTESIPAQTKIMIAPPEQKVRTGSSK